MRGNRKPLIQRVSPRAGLSAPIRRSYRAQVTLAQQKVWRPAMAALETVENASAPLPSLDPQQTAQKDGGWGVTVFNNDSNTYEEVIIVLMAATGCNSEEAYIEAWEIDHYGQCLVHRGSEDVCKTAAKTIASIGIKVEVGPID
jgi:ATP-dependent Clp protease adapter protein ClpS